MKPITNLNLIITETLFKSDFCILSNSIPRFQLASITKKDRSVGAAAETPVGGSVDPRPTEVLRFNFARNCGGRLQQRSKDPDVEVVEAAASESQRRPRRGKPPKWAM
jgi:hypothetical protein